MYKKISASVQTMISKPLYGVIGVTTLTAIALAMYSSEPAREIPLNLPESPLPELLEELQPEVVELPSFEYQIRPDDTLSGIFSTLGLSYSDLLPVMEADVDFLHLASIQPGDTLRIWQDKTGQLNKLELEKNIAEKMVYQRMGEKGFEVSEIRIPGEWEETVLAGSVVGSFSVSAKKAGLTYNEIDEITRLLRDKLNFARDLRAGDKFEVVRSSQFVEGEPSGKRALKAFRLEQNGNLITAYLHDDGNFYDANGESLQRAFLRYPTSKKWRISSGFNPNRLHPVTKRRSPHKGTDFAAPTGTPVLATSDGVVAMTANHPYAGRYIVIRHNQTYSTRYLHNSRIMVRKGQEVKRGQKIALSGATGRVAGAHIHYELLINGRAVDAMKAKIPMAKSIPAAEKKAFMANVAKYNAEMDGGSVVAAGSEEQPPAV